MALACTTTNTPHSAFWLVTGCFGTSLEVPPAGFEPAHTAPEAVALSPELRGPVAVVATGRTLPAPGGWTCTGFSVVAVAPGPLSGVPFPRVSVHPYPQRVEGMHRLLKGPSHGEEVGKTRTQPEGRA